MKISFKFGLANLIMVFLIITLGSAFVITEQKTIEGFNDLAENNYPFQVLLKDIQANIQGRGMSELSFIVTQNPQYLEKISQRTKVIQANIQQAKTLKIDSEEREKIDLLEKELEAYLRLSETVQRNVQENDLEGAQTIHYGEEMMAADDLIKDVDKLLEHKTEAVATNIGNIRQISSRGLMLAFTITLISILIAALSWLWLSRSIVSPLRNLTEISSKIARGDLTLKLNRRETAKDEVQLLSNHFGIKT